MTLYLYVETDIEDAMIDFIEIRLNTGVVVSLNWDETELTRTSGGFEARYKGVYFGEDYANGRICELEGSVITAVQVYTETEGKEHITFKRMDFYDNEESMVFAPPIYEENYELIFEG